MCLAAVQAAIDQLGSLADVYVFNNRDPDTGLLVPEHHGVSLGDACMVRDGAVPSIVGIRFIVKAVVAAK